MAEIRVKRAFDPVERSDGQRLLVDGMWPRGVAKADMELTDWLKALAPSKELRQWFGHDPEKWETFRDRYMEELDEGGEAVDKLKDYVRAGRVTLIYAAKDTDHNNAVALKEWLEQER